MAVLPKLVGERIKRREDPALIDQITVFRGMPTLGTNVLPPPMQKRPEYIALLQQRFRHKNTFVYRLPHAVFVKGEEWGTIKRLCIQWEAAEREQRWAHVNQGCRGCDASRLQTGRCP